MWYFTFYIYILVIPPIQPYVLQYSNNTVLYTLHWAFFILIIYRGSRAVKNNSLQSDTDWV